MKKLIVFGATVFILIIVASACKDSGFSVVSADVRDVKITAKAPGKAVVVIGGDTMLDDLALPYILAYGYDYMLKDISKVFSAADVAVVNLECSVTDQCKRETKRYSYFMKPEGLAALKNAGINIVTTANNHLMDCGEEGLKATLSNLEKAGIEQVGGGIDQKQIHTALIMNVSGIKIGFASFFDYNEATKPEGYARIQKGTIAGVLKALKSKADVVVPIFHWGANYKNDIDKKQREYAEFAVKYGANLVVGHHPHIAQAVAMIKHVPVIYSLGNCAFGTGNNQVSSAVLCRFVATKKGLTTVELLPLATQNRNPKVLWQPKILSGQDAQEMMKNIVKKSRSLGASLDDEGGVYKIEL